MKHFWNYCNCPISFQNLRKQFVFGHLWIFSEVVFGLEKPLRSCYFVFVKVRVFSFNSSLLEIALNRLYVQSGHMVRNYVVTQVT